MMTILSITKPLNHPNRPKGATERALDTTIYLSKRTKRLMMCITFILDDLVGLKSNAKLPVLDSTPYIDKMFEAQPHLIFVTAKKTTGL